MTEERSEGDEVEYSLLQNPYEMLGVSETASLSEIESKKTTCCGDILRR